MIADHPVQRPLNYSASTECNIISSERHKWRNILGVFTSRTVCRRMNLNVHATGNESGSEGPLIYETTIRFIPCFGYRVFIWNTRTAYGNIERSLRTAVIDDTSELWRFCGAGDVLSFQAAVSRGASPFVIDRTGENLYHVKVHLNYPGAAC